MHIKSILITAATLLSLACPNIHLSAGPVKNKASSVIQVPGSDSIPVELTMTGSATRIKFFVKVYQITHYMQNPPNVTGDAAIQQILENDSNIKLFSIKWLRKATGPQVQVAFRESFEKTLGNNYASLKSQIDQFLSFFAKGGDVNSVSTITWKPGGVITVEFNGKKVGEITNPQLANAVWQIWFGPYSVVNKAELVSLL